MRIASHESPYTVVAPMTAIVATVVGSMSEAPAMRPEPDDLRRSNGRNDGAFSRSPCPGPAVGPLTTTSVSKKCCSTAEYAQRHAEQCSGALMDFRRGS